MVQKDKSILIVDDSETNLVLLQAVLYDKGWVVRTAASATLAMKSIKSEKPDLILLDLLMPKIDGQQMLEQLKSDDRLKDIPVIVISAITDNKTRKACLEKGAIYYMTKPVKIPQLLQIIQNVFDASVS